MTTDNAMPMTSMIALHSPLLSQERLEAILQTTNYHNTPYVNMTPKLT